MAKRRTSKTTMMGCPAVAEYFGVSIITVHEWIRSGQLPAMNLWEDPQNPDKRPRWAVHPNDLDEFRKRRTRKAQNGAETKRRRRGQSLGTVEQFV